MRYIFCWGRLEDLSLFVLGGRSKGILWKPIYLLARFFSSFISRDYKEGGSSLQITPWTLLPKKTPKRAYIISVWSPPFTNVSGLLYPEIVEPHTLLCKLISFPCKVTFFQKLLQLTLSWDLTSYPNIKLPFHAGFFYCLRCWYKKHHTLQD